MCSENETYQIKTETLISEKKNNLYKNRNLVIMLYGSAVIYMVVRL